MESVIFLGAVLAIVAIALYHFGKKMPQSKGGGTSHPHKIDDQPQKKEDLID